MDQSATPTRPDPADGEDRARITELGRDYWEHGAGALKIRWGTHGATRRCHQLLMEHAGFTSEQAWGYCANRHHAVLGTWPGQEKRSKEEAMPDSKKSTDSKTSKTSGEASSKTSGDSKTSSDFDEAAHPRAPAGDPDGGQFEPAGSSESKDGDTTASNSAKQAEISAIQKLLGLPETGEFSAEDKAAIRKYQQEHGLQVDGIVGTQTLASLLGDDKRGPGPLTADDRKKLADIAGTSQKKEEKKSGSEKSKEEPKEKPATNSKEKLEEKLAGKPKKSSSDDAGTRAVSGMTVPDYDMDGAKGTLDLDDSWTEGLDDLPDLSGITVAILDEICEAMGAASHASTSGGDA